MNVALVLALLTISFAAPTSRMAGVVALSPGGGLTLDHHEKVKLAGISVTKPKAVQAFLKEHLLNKVVKVDWEPKLKDQAHVFVSLECKDVAKYTKEAIPESGASCVRSVYVNGFFLSRHWAKPMPKGIELYREKLFPEPPPKSSSSKMRRVH